MAGYGIGANDMKKCRAVAALIVLFCLLFQGNALALNKYPINYIYVGEKNQKITNSSGHIYIPVTYTVQQVYAVVEDETAAGFNYPDDIFIAGNDEIYVADTGNDRIVRLAQDGSTVAIYTGTSDSRFSGPRGVFVDDNGVIYVADSGNSRIVEMDGSGNLLHEYRKPESELLDSVQEFIPTKVVVGPTGYIYTLVGKDLMAIDRSGRFKGYIGATDLDFDLWYTLLKSVLTDEQVAKLDKRTPPAYNNFMLNNDGLFLAVTNADKDQIRILNSVGTNIYPTGFYGEILSIDSEKNEYIRPRFADVTCDKNGVISALDQESGYIYQYDKEGNILAVFGGKGNNMGYFDMPISIATDSTDCLYVLDATRKNIQKFASTSFMDKIHLASQTYFDGDYTSAEAACQEILSLCADYPLAHRRLGSIYYKSERYDEAKEQYALAEDMDGYSESFAKARHQFVRDHFFLVAMIAGAIIAALAVLTVYSKRHADRVRDRSYDGGRR